MISNLMGTLKSAAVAAVTVLAMSGGAQADSVLGARLSAVLGLERQHLAMVPSSELNILRLRPSAEARGIATIKPGEVAPAGSRSVTYTRAFVDAQPRATGGESFECLANVLYHEARGETIEGMFAVGEVVLNRVDSSKFPNSVCGVVYQSNRRGCQFSWTCDGRPDTIRERAAYNRVAKVARLLIDGASRDLTKGATYFHTTNISPSWSRVFARTARYGAHVFYRG